MAGRDPEARIWLALIALLYVLAAVRLPGYLHPDEHFQTLEWARYSLGLTSADALPWEFGARIRPWLQPALYAAVGEVISPRHGLTFALACRLLTAALAWGGVAMLGRRFMDWFPEPGTRRLAWIGTATFYLLPALRVRTSSESLGAALFMMALALSTAPRDNSENRRGRDLGAGLLLGLAFSARYQLAFMGLGLVAWLLWVGRDRHRTARIVAGAVIATLLALCVDRWGYGQWQLTPWRYAYENLVAGRAASFGEDPSWAYVGFLWHDLALPFNLIALTALPVALLRAPRHPLVWVNLPFVLGHSLVGHKELRFLFPYLFFVPCLAALAFGPLLLRLSSPVRRGVLASLLALNLWWLALDRLPTLSAGPWMAPLLAAELPIYHGNLDPFGKDGLHTGLYAGGRTSRPMGAEAASQSAEPLVYYLYQRDPPALPSGLQARCTRLAVWPPVWSVLPQAWLTSEFGRRLFFTHERHAVYRCPSEQPE